MIQSMRYSNQKPFGTRRRWIVVAVLWLGAMYVASVGPAAYVIGRGWLGSRSENVIVSLYAPLTYIVSHKWPLSRLLMDYSHWWQQLGERHSA